jgi:hypothetical protein
MTSRSLTVSFSISTLLVFAPNAGAGGGTRLESAKITAAAAPWMVFGGRVAISGRVTPHLAGIRITLERQQGTVWLPIGATKSQSLGGFSFVNRPGKLGLATYRVVTSPGTSYVGASASVPVEVLEWTYLGNTYVRPGAGELSTDPIVSNGVTYKNPVALDAGCYNAWGGDAWVDYDLGRRYETFTATVGLPDSAQAGSAASYGVLGDGKTLSSGNLVPGTSTKIKISLSGISRLRLFSNVPDPTGAAGCGNYFLQVVFGDAQVLGP